MNKITTKIAALTLISTMIASCGINKENIEIKQKNNKESKLLEKVTSINNIYIVEIKDIQDNSKIYLAKHYTISSQNTNYEEFRLLNNDNIRIASNRNSNQFISNYGEYVKNIRINKFLSYYDIDIKEFYSTEEIFDIFEKIKQDYDKFPLEKFDNVNQKKLTK